jgi:predicted anti-sigma-YlaC factor YlaD
VLSVYVVGDAVAGRVTADRVLTHLPVLVGAVLAWLVWRSGHPDVRRPDHTALTQDEEIVLPQNAARGRRRGHLRPSDGSAA